MMENTEPKGGRAERVPGVRVGDYEILHVPV